MDLSEEAARRRDEADPGHRELFHIPPAEGGRYPETAYLLGNSLGLQPKATREELLTDLAAWARYGVEAHFHAERPWLAYHRLLTEPAARLIGALPEETVMMNALTVNLHLLMVSFYRPAGDRTRIVIEDGAFPSDSYAVRSQAALHGLDPDVTVVRLPPEAIVDFLGREGSTVALVLLGAVNYLTGELLDIPAITAAGHAAGAFVGWDLAHAAGNVQLRMHDWGADFAAWCSYKYLNGGPGAVAGAFVHERHVGARVPRLEGWWGTDVATRFEMAPISRPPASADAWQISNPPLLSMSPVRTSLELFDQVGMAPLRARSQRLTAYLEELLDGVLPLVTPRDPARRGCQLSLRVTGAAPAEVVRRLRVEHGVIADNREPDIIRLAPVPLYSSYHDCWRAATALTSIVG